MAETGRASTAAALMLAEESSRVFPSSLCSPRLISVCFRASVSLMWWAAEDPVTLTGLAGRGGTLAEGILMENRHYTQKATFSTTRLHFTP